MLPVAGGPGGHPLEVGTQNLYVADDEDGECPPVKPPYELTTCVCGIVYAAEVYPEGCGRCARG